MKTTNSVFIFFLCLLFISCNEAAKKSTELQKEHTDSITENIKNSVSNDNEASNYKIALDFEKFATQPFEITEKAKLDISSNDAAKSFKTRIIDAYKSSKIDFASYYISVVFVFGIGCVSGFIIDTRDGKVYNLPLGEENACPLVEDRAIYKPNSKLFIAGVCKENPASEKVYYNAFLWDESKKLFLKVGEDEILKGQ